MEIKGSRAVITRWRQRDWARHRACARGGRRTRRSSLADIDINAADGERTAAELRARGTDAVHRMVDVGRLEDIEALADFAWGHMGGVDLVFNNAGASRLARAFEISDQDIAWLIQINIMAVVNGSRVFGRRMLEAPTKGWITNTSSQAGILGRTPFLATYTGTKHFVVGYTDTLRSDYRPARLQRGLAGPRRHQYVAGRADARARIWRPSRRRSDGRGLYARERHPARAGGPFGRERHPRRRILHLDPPLARNLRGAVPRPARKLRAAMARCHHRTAQALPAGQGNSHRPGRGRGRLRRLWPQGHLE